MRSHSSSRGAPGGGTTTRWARSAGRPADQRLEDRGHVLVAPELLVVLVAAHRGEEAAVGLPGAHLDPLLPRRGQHPSEVAGRDDDVDLVGGAGEVGERGRRRLGGGVGEVLVGEQHVAGPVPRLLDEAPPGVALAVDERLDDGGHALDDGGCGEVVAAPRRAAAARGSRSSSRCRHHRSCRKEVPDFAVPTWRNTRRAMRVTLLAWRQTRSVAWDRDVLLRHLPARSRRPSRRASTRASRRGTRRCCCRWCASSTCAPTAGSSTSGAARAPTPSGSRPTSASACSASTRCSATSTSPARPVATSCPTSPPRLAFERGTATDLPVADASLDLVWCRDVMVHVEHPDDAFAEFARVLRPGGHVVALPGRRHRPARRRGGRLALRRHGRRARLRRPAGDRRRDRRGPGSRWSTPSTSSTEWGEWSQEQDGSGRPRAAAPGAAAARARALPRRVRRRGVRRDAGRLPLARLPDDGQARRRGSTCCAARR